MRRLTILFVDDDPGAQEKIKYTLGNDFLVQCATSVTDAKVALNESVPDLLISEIVLGQENGLDLCRYVRSQTALCHLPIMLLTSQTTLQDKVAGFDAGTDDYVVKPFDAHHLKVRIRLLVRIKHLERRANV